MTRYPYVKRRHDDFRAPRWLMIGFAAGYIALVLLIIGTVVARLA